MTNIVLHLFLFQNITLGAPFLFGAGSVILALLLAFFIPDNAGLSGPPKSPSRKEYVYSGDVDSSTEASQDATPLLIQDTS